MMAQQDDAEDIGDYGEDGSMVEGGEVDDRKGREEAGDAAMEVVPSPDFLAAIDEGRLGQHIQSCFQADADPDRLAEVVQQLSVLSMDDEHKHTLMDFNIVDSVLSALMRHKYSQDLYHWGIKLFNILLLADDGGNGDGESRFQAAFSDWFMERSRDLLEVVIRGLRLYAESSIDIAMASLVVLHSLETERRARQLPLNVTLTHEAIRQLATCMTFHMQSIDVLENAVYTLQVLAQDDQLRIAVAGQVPLESLNTALESLADNPPALLDVLALLSSILRSEECRVLILVGDEETDQKPATNSAGDAAHDAEQAKIRERLEALLSAVDQVLASVRVACAEQDIELPQDVNMAVSRLEKDGDLSAYADEANATIVEVYVRAHQIKPLINNCIVQLLDMWRGIKAAQATQQETRESTFGTQLPSGNSAKGSFPRRDNSGKTTTANEGTSSSAEKEQAGLEAPDQESKLVADANAETDAIVNDRGESKRGEGDIGAGMASPLATGTLGRHRAPAASVAAVRAGDANGSPTSPRRRAANRVVVEDEPDVRTRITLMDLTRAAQDEATAALEQCEKFAALNKKLRAKAVSDRREIVLLRQRLRECVATECELREQLADTRSVLERADPNDTKSMQVVQAALSEARELENAHKVATSEYKAHRDHLAKTVSKVTEERNRAIREADMMLEVHEQEQRRATEQVSMAQEELLIWRTRHDRLVDLCEEAAHIYGLRIPVQENDEEELEFYSGGMLRHKFNPRRGAPGFGPRYSGGRSRTSVGGGASVGGASFASTSGLHMHMATPSSFRGVGGFGTGPGSATGFVGGGASAQQIQHLQALQQQVQQQYQQQQQQQQQQRQQQSLQNGPSDQQQPFMGQDPQDPTAPQMPASPTAGKAGVLDGQERELAASRFRRRQRLADLQAEHARRLYYHHHDLTRSSNPRIFPPAAVVARVAELNKLQDANDEDGPGATESTGPDSRSQHHQHPHHPQRTLGRSTSRLEALRARHGGHGMNASVMTMESAMLSLGRMAEQNASKMSLTDVAVATARAIIKALLADAIASHGMPPFATSASLGFAVQYHRQQLRERQHYLRQQPESFRQTDEDADDVPLDSVNQLLRLYVHMPPEGQVKHNKTSSRSKSRRNGTTQDRERPSLASQGDSDESTDSGSESDSDSDESGGNGGGRANGTRAGDAGMSSTGAGAGAGAVPEYDEESKDEPAGAGDAERVAKQRGAPRTDGGHVDAGKLGTQDSPHYMRVSAVLDKLARALVALFNVLLHDSRGVTVSVPILRVRRLIASVPGLVQGRVVAADVDLLLAQASRRGALFCVETAAADVPRKFLSRSDSASTLAEGEEPPLAGFVPPSRMGKLPPAPSIRLLRQCRQEDELASLGGGIAGAAGGFVANRIGPTSRAGASTANGFDSSVETFARAIPKGEIALSGFCDVVLLLAAKRFANLSLVDVLVRLARIIQAGYESYESSAATTMVGTTATGVIAGSGTASSALALSATGGGARSVGVDQANGTGAAGTGGLGESVLDQLAARDADAVWLGERDAANTLSKCGVTPESLDAIERLLEREKRIMEAIFDHYVRNMRRTHLYMTLPMLTLFCRDFALVPAIISQATCQRVFLEVLREEGFDNAQLVAAISNAQFSTGTAPGTELAHTQPIGGMPGGGATGVGAVGLADTGAGNTADGMGAPFDVTAVGLTLDTFLEWLGRVSVTAEWFDVKMAGIEPEHRVGLVLQFMDSSPGKKRINERSRTTVIPRFVSTRAGAAEDAELVW